MKRKLLKRNKGFTLVECIVAIGVFAVMSALVMQILALAIRQHRNNNRIEQDLDAQVQKIIAMDNSLLQSETIDIVMGFIKDGTNNAAGNLAIDNVIVYQNPQDEENPGRLELNTFDATIAPDTGGNNTNNQGGNMVTAEDRCYGTKGLDSIKISCAENFDGNKVTVTLNVEIADSSDILCQSIGNAFKVTLPGYASNLVVNAKSNTSYLRMSTNTDSMSYRIYPTSLSNRTDPSVTFTFEMSKADYEEKYICSGRFYGAKDPNMTTGTITYMDREVPGIYRAI